LSQRISSRTRRRSWTELNKERVGLIVPLFFEVFNLQRSKSIIGNIKGVSEDWSV
jgi:hypothetical protein